MAGRLVAGTGVGIRTALERASLPCAGAAVRPKTSSPIDSNESKRLLLRSTSVHLPPRFVRGLDPHEPSAQLWYVLLKYSPAVWRKVVSRFHRVSSRQTVKLRAPRAFPSSLPGESATGEDAPMEIPRTRYARSEDGTFIAYQVFGDGPDLLLAPAWISHLELSWETVELGGWLRALGRFARVISMDQRGIGLSDRMTQMIDLETRVDDARAVLDAAGSERPVLYGQGLDGGAICAMFAATYPERTAGLLLWSGQASGIRDADWPWGSTAEENAAFQQLIADTWGDEDLVGPLLSIAGAPSKADDPRARKEWARFMRYAASRGDALVHERMFEETDYRSILPAIHVPTTILQPDDEGLPAAEWMASQIPGAKVVVLPESADYPPELSHRTENLEAPAGSSPTSRPGSRTRPGPGNGALHRHRGFDCHGGVPGRPRWRDVLERHHGIVRGALGRYRGRGRHRRRRVLRHVRRPGARRPLCRAHHGCGRPLDVEIRAGVHTGECQTIDGKVGGLGVVIGARIGSRAKRASSRVADGQGPDRRKRALLRRGRGARAQGGPRSLASVPGAGRTGVERSYSNITCRSPFQVPPVPAYRSSRPRSPRRSAPRSPRIPAPDRDA